MDAATTLGTVSIIVALISLGASAALTYRQLKLGRHANHASALMYMYSEMRSLRFHANYNFIVHRLQAEHSPEDGVYGLPAYAQAAVIDIAYYYQNLANMMHFGLLDKRAILPMIRSRIINLWFAIKPFVEAERRRPTHTGTVTLLQYLEKYAEEAQGEM
jgi:hypothetical protein